MLFLKSQQHGQICSGCRNGGDLLDCDFCAHSVCHAVGDSIFRTSACLTLSRAILSGAKFKCLRCHHNDRTKGKTPYHVRFFGTHFLDWPLTCCSFRHFLIRKMSLSMVSSRIWIGKHFLSSHLLTVVWREFFTSASRASTPKRVRTPLQFSELAAIFRKTSVRNWFRSRFVSIWVETMGLRGITMISETPCSCFRSRK